MKKLPIVLPPDIVSECWTIYKMAIIQTHPNVEEWIASKKLDVFFDAKYRPFYAKYGENGTMYPLSHFHDILNYGEVPIHDPDDIIDRIQREIEDGRYIVVDLNFTTLTGDTDHDAPYIHEILIYGYDQERRIFYYGGAEERELPYDLFAENFAFVWEFYRDHPERRYIRRMWHFPVTSIGLNLEYNNDNAGYELLRKLEREQKVGTQIEYRYNAAGEKEEEFVNHFGIYALLFLRDKLVQMTEDSPSEEIVHNIMLSILKLCEHRALLLRSMNWFIARNGFLERAETAGPMRAACGRYENCVSKMKIVYFLYLKYMQKGDAGILHKLVDRLQVQYRLEYEALDGFLKTARAFYY